jgi:hypothetical protein
VVELFEPERQSAAIQDSVFTKPRFCVSFGGLLGIWMGTLPDSFTPTTMDYVSDRSPLVVSCPPTHSSSRHT